MQTYANDLTGTPETTEQKTTNRIESVTSSAHKTIDKVSESARPAVDRLTASAHHAVDSLAGIACGAADTLGVKGEQLKGATDHMTQSARDFVRENPLMSLGIAVAGGLLLSRLLSSR